MNEIFENREMFACATGIFVAAFALGIISARRSRGNENATGLSLSEFFLTASGWFLLTLALGRRIAASGHLPFSNIFEVFQSLGWCAIFSAVLLRAVWHLRVPAFFPTGAAALLCAVGFANARVWDAFPAPAGTPGETSSWLAGHVGFATIGYACFSAAAMVWILFLLQNFALRHRFSHRFFAKLPDLAALDRIGGRLCSAGLVFFGAGIIIGFAALLSGAPLGSERAVYKTFVSAVIFFGFLAAQILRQKNKISALKFARAGTLIFFAAIILLGGIACIKATEAGSSDPVQIAGGF